MRKLLEEAKRIDINRRNEWIKVQGPLKELGKLAIVPYQGLAKIDATLIIEDQNIIDDKPSAAFGDLNDQLTQSYLWVLGAFEIIRTLCQFSAENKSHLLHNKLISIRTLKHKFERIRVPLAKFEAARKNPQGFQYAWPTLDKNLGTAWLISETEYISRRELSDDFLKLMVELSSLFDAD